MEKGVTGFRTKKGTFCNQLTCRITLYNLIDTEGLHSLNKFRAKLRLVRFQSAFIVLINSYDSFQQYEADWKICVLTHATVILFWMISTIGACGSIIYTTSLFMCFIKLLLMDWNNNSLHGKKKYFRKKHN